MTRSSMLLAGLLAGAAVVLPAGGRAAPAGDAVIAFSSTPANADRPDIYVMRADGSGVRRMTRKGGGEPAWSPDGRRRSRSRARCRGRSARASGSSARAAAPSDV